MPFAPRSTARAERAEPSFSPLAARAREPVPVRPAAAARAAPAAPEIDTRRAAVMPRIATEIARPRPRDDADTLVLTLSAADRPVMSSGGRAGHAEPQRRRGGILRGLAFAVLLLLAAVGTATVVHAFQGLLGH
jgi:hypothetical protein